MIFLVLVVSIFSLTVLFIRFKDSEVIWICESPKVQIVNPFWKEVSDFSKKVNFFLFLRDLMLCCNVEYHLEGYIKAKTTEDFSKAVIEAEKSMGKKYEVYRWGKGQLIRIKKMGLVLVLEK